MDTALRARHGWLAVFRGGGAMGARVGDPGEVASAGE
jgi:hypothetical protein